MSSLKGGVHESGLNYLEHGGHQRVLGCLPANPNLVSYQSTPLWADEMPVLPRSEWQETNPDDFGAPVLDQDGHGACNGYAAVMAMILEWLASGNPYIPFSGDWMYGLINGGRDAGSVISDAAEAGEKIGFATTDLIPQWEIYQSRFPKEAWEEAKKYRYVKRLRLQSFDEICTALQYGWKVNSGIIVGSNYADLDSNGIVPRQRGRRGGHARCSYALEHVNGIWVPRTRNSWNESYGMNGDCREPEYLFGAPGSIDAYALKAVSIDASPNLPPSVAA